MTNDAPHIELEQLKAWLAATGYLLPTNEVELECFLRLYKAELAAASSDAKGAIDVDRILQGKPRPIVKSISRPEAETPTEFTELRMVARNGKKVPDHILKKMTENQRSKKKDGE